MLRRLLAVPLALAALGLWMSACDDGDETPATSDAGPANAADTGGPSTDARASTQDANDNDVGTSSSGDSGNPSDAGSDASDAGIDASEAGTDADAEAGAIHVPCAMTVSGGKTASGPCTLTMEHEAASGKIKFGVVLTADPTTSFGSTLSSAATLSTGTYTGANVEDYNGTVINGAHVWTASKTDATGSFTLVITDTGAPATSGADTFYPNVAGTLDATIPAVDATGATGTTTFHVDL